MTADVMTDEEFARIVGPHPVRVGDSIYRGGPSRRIYNRRMAEYREVGWSSGTVIDVADDGFILRWDNTRVRRFFRLRDEGRLWVRAQPPRAPLPPSPWVPPRKRLGCCVDRDYEGASHSCTEHTCMHLPIIGQTCSDCRHVERCTTMFGQKADATYCQFFPRRFSPKPTSNSATTIANEKHA